MRITKHVAGGGSWSQFLTKHGNFCAWAPKTSYIFIFYRRNRKFFPPRGFFWGGQKTPISNIQTRLLALFFNGSCWKSVCTLIVRPLLGLNIKIELLSTRAWLIFFADFYLYSRDRRYKEMRKDKKGGGSSFPHCSTKHGNFCARALKTGYIFIFQHRNQKNVLLRGLFLGSKKPQFSDIRPVSWPCFSMDLAENQYEHSFLDLLET